ncbi:MAG: thiamine-phosphate kinase [Victivallaceae bacterium]|nr:thiamine-phosphate kinase [Victivallaceae bacterium]
MPEELKIVRALADIFGGGRDLRIGIGDDCAEIGVSKNALLVAADQVIENIHYDSRTAAYAAGQKLLLRNVSDVAAMGGTPRWAVLTVAVGKHDAQYVLDFCRGVAGAGKQWGVTVVGGDTAALPQAGCVATLTILGEASSSGSVTRSGARAGDFLYVTGKIGGSFASGRHLDFTPRLKEGRFLADHRLASAMLDVSDGLLLDASRLAQASGVALEIEPEKVPLHADASAPGAWSDGEDYELLFTSPKPLETVWPEDFAPLCRWGRCVEGDGELLNPGGSRFICGKLGYEH